MGTPVNAAHLRAGIFKASITTDYYGRSLDASQEEAAQKIEERVTPILIELQ